MTEQPPGETAPRPKPPRPRRGGAVDAAGRIGLVLLLLGVAIAGLSGRRDLDWAALSKSPGSAWIDLLLVAGAAFVVVSAFRTLARLLRLTKESDEQPAVAGAQTKPPWYGQLAALGVIALAVFLVYLLLANTQAAPVKFRDPGAINAGNVGHDSNSGHAAFADSRALVIAALVGAVLAISVIVARRNADRDEEDPEDGEEPTEQEVLADAVAAAEVELDSHGDDTRAAIIAAYIAMERQLVAGGIARRASDTPTDFLHRAMAASQVSRGAATRLTELFREARFSTHPMAPGARSDAARALARVADDLANDQARPRG